MRWHLIFTLSILSVSLLGCLSKPISSTSVVNIGGEGIIVEIWASSDCTQPGDRIKLRATVTNETSKPYVVEVTEKPVFDIAVRNQGPTVRWSDDKPLTPDLTRLELKPSESKAIKMDWTVKSPSSGSVFYVDSYFIYNPSAPGGPVGSSVLINVSVCPGPFGP